MVEAQKKEHETTAQGGFREGNARVRTCVGCGERVEIPRAGATSAALVRLVLGPSGEVAVDAAGGGFGRGAHVHSRPACVEKAAARGLARAARGKVSLLWTDEPLQEGSTAETSKAKLVALDAASLARAIVVALDRRVQGLVVSAARARRIAPGADAVTSAEERGEAAVIVVATDAAAGAELGVVRRAVTDGRAVAWGTKQVLGGLCSAADSSKRSQGLAVIAIKDDRIGRAIKEAVQAASALVGMASSESSSSSFARGRRRAQHPEGAARGHTSHDGVGAGPSAASEVSDAEEDVARSAQGRRADG